MHRILTISALFTLTAGTALFAAVQSAPSKPNAPQSEENWVPVNPPVAWFGSYSAITAREHHIITDPAAWDALWVRHVGARAEKDSYGNVMVPSVDFSNFMVLAIFNGEAWNTRIIQMFDQCETPDDFRIRYDAMSYQVSTGPSENDPPLVIPVGATPEHIAKAAADQANKAHEKREAGKNTDPHFTRAYCIYVLPRTAKPVKLFENVQRLKDQPPKWKEQ